MRFGHPPGGRMEHPSPRLGERFNRPPGSRMQLQNVSQQSKGFGGPPTGPTRMERPPFRPGKGFGQTSNNANLEELPAASPAKKKPATDKPDGNIQSRLLSLSGMAPGPSQEKPDSRKRGGSEPAVVHPEKRSNVPPPEQQQQLQPPPLTQQQPQPPPPKQQQQPPPHKNAVPSLLEIPIKTVVAGPSVHRKPNVLDSVAEIATPLCKFPMEEQLIMKEDRTLEFFNELGEKITGVNGACRAWFDHQIAKHEYYVKLDRILPSPMVEGYCNHCEFAIGTHPDTKQLTIGYTYEATNAFVGPIQHLVHIPGPIKQLVFRLESILRETKVKPFDQKTSQGCWIKLNARISAESGIMVTLTLNAKGMEAAALKNFKTKMVSALTESQQLMVTSVYIVARSQLDSGKPELIFGEKSILSAVVDKSFHVSPFSSYSRNISTMVEILKLLRQMSNLTAQTSLVDICCGSGTIGIALSPFCGQVIGLDVLPEAVDEARVNSVENDADNCEFHVGSAEEFLPSLWSRVVFMEDVVCIMDLPPSGLAAKAVQHIRKQSAIKRFFLILSDPRGCLQTCLAFARMPSNQTKGDPFIPVRAIPVDTHPHTHGFTILIMFVRMKIGDLLNPESINLEDVSATSDRVSNSSDPPAADGAATPSDLSDQQQSSEPDGKEGGPDLSWKPVTKEGELAASRERLLTPDNLDWLNQMNNVHGSSFERAQWIETLLMQQNSASAEQTPPT